MTPDDAARLVADNPEAVFHIDLNTVADTLEELRRRVCAYASPNFCDCKYANVGTHGKPLGTSEATGCPELRDAIRLLGFTARAVAAPATESDA